MNGIFAMSATAFFLAFIASTVVYGGEQARYLATIAAFVGALSQFLAQDHRDSVKLVSIVVAYAAMALGVAALVVWQ